MVRARTPAADYVFGQLLYDTLYVLSPNGQIAPSLATKTDISADGLTWTITLRSGVMFTDGTPLDAAAVKINLDIRETTRGFILKQQIAAIERVDVVNSTTVKLVLSRPQRRSRLSSVARPSASRARQR